LRSILKEWIAHYNDARPHAALSPGIPFVDREFRTLASREHRGCFGKPSGGYGAILHGMKYAKYWGAIANHSGDAYFDFVYWHDWPNTLDELARHRALESRSADRGHAEAPLVLSCRRHGPTRKRVARG